VLNLLFITTIRNIFACSNYQVKEETGFVGNLTSAHNQAEHFKQEKIQMFWRIRCWSI